ncbi:uncharacterized protein METZ01_LOCUS342316, partial [marine metagenome]
VIFTGSDLAQGPTAGVLHVLIEGPFGIGHDLFDATGRETAVADQSFHRTRRHLAAQGVER